MAHHGAVRRALAAALLGISLWIGSLAWSGFLLTRTVLDPDRSRAVAEALYEDDAVRARLGANIADGVQAALPEGFPVDDAVIEAGATQALDSPAVEAVFVDAFVRTHQAMLGEGEVPRSVDPGAVGAAGRDALVASRPELDAVLPAAPELAVSLPTDRVPNLGPVRRGLLTAVPVLATAAAVGVLLALVVARNRPAVVRRAGIWAITLSAVVLAFAYGLPALAATVVPDQSEVIAALVGAMAAETRVPAITLGAVGSAGIVASLLWRAAPAVLSDPAPPSRPAPRRRPRREPRLVGGPPPRPVRRDLPVPPRPDRRAHTSAPVARPQRDPGADPTRHIAHPDPTRHDVARPAVDAAPAGGNADATRHGDAVPVVDGPTRWVAGLGWVVESADHIPPEARWVPGVGYVVEEG